MPSSTVNMLKGFRSLPREWHTGLCGVPCTEPLCCIASAVCFPCASYTVRKEALGGDFSEGKYECCQGYYCGCCARCVPCTRSCPSLCMCFEAVLCPHLSIMGTRHYIQEQYQIKNTCGENACLDFMICLECVMCCLEEDNPIRECIHCAVHAVCCVAMPCMMAQHHHQMKQERRGGLSSALVAQGQGEHRCA